MILNDIAIDSEEMQALYRSHVLPQPHLHEGRFLASQSGIRAAIDTSDGLSSDLGHIAEESKVGATLYSDKIPVSDLLQKFCDPNMNNNNTRHLVFTSTTRFVNFYIHD